MHEWSIHVGYYDSGVMHESSVHVGPYESGIMHESSVHVGSYDSGIMHEANFHVGSYDSSIMHDPGHGTKYINRKTLPKQNANYWLILIIPANYTINNIQYYSS